MAEVKTSLGDDSLISHIDSVLQSVLQPNEHLVWWARPNPQRMRRSLIEASGKALPVVAGIAVLFDLIMAVLMATVAAPAGQAWSTIQELWPLFVFFPLLMCLMVPLLWVRGSIRWVSWVSRITPTLNCTLYAITDARAISIVASPGKNPVIVEYQPCEVGKISRLERRDGWGNLTFGEPRVFRTTPLGGLRMRQITFLGIPQVRQVHGLLIRLRDSSRPC